MNFRNLSRYPTDEVQKLVMFGMQGINHEDVNVSVMDIPHVHGEGLTATYKGLGAWIGCDVKLGVGSPRRFPADNIFHAPSNPRLDGKPYGGSWDTYAKYMDWQEFLVAVAAHEGQHVQDGKSGNQKSTDFSGDLSEERRAEAHALKILTKYRSLRGAL